MCEECEDATPLAAVHIRKANRFGWRPPVAAATAPRCDDGFRGERGDARAAAGGEAPNVKDATRVEPCA